MLENSIVTTKIGDSTYPLARILLNYVGDEINHRYVTDDTIFDAG